jgi:Dyp-type peroxidase family
MALDLNLTNVDPTVNTFKPMLDDIQPNILKGHGRSYAWHLFVNLQPGKVQEAKAWIADFAKHKIFSGAEQLVHRENFKENGADGGPVFTLSISAAGYHVLGVDHQFIPGDASFVAGMKASGNKLSDPSPTSWEKPFQETIHLLVIVADSNPVTAKTLGDTLAAEINQFGTVLLLQKGKGLHQSTTGNNAINIEHNGYADGVSQPMYLKDENDAQTKNKIWKDAEPLKIVLVKDPGGKTEDSFGSYLVFRKLEQNVKAFKENEGDFGNLPTKLPDVIDETGKKNEDLPGSMVVGRYENSTPTVLQSIVNPKILKPEDESNDFDYSEDKNGSKCPFHAHIRLANPRIDVTTKFAHSIRLTRRGIPYDDIQPNGRFGKPDTEDINVTVAQLDKTAKTTTKDVGLLFFCYQADIANQFEFIQSTWVNHGTVGSATRVVGQDGVIGQGPNSFQKELPERWSQSLPANKITFGGHVTLKGGEYFFTPSLSFLRNLDK